MSKIANAFKDGKAFIAFLTGGDPAPENGGIYSDDGESRSGSD